MTSELAVCTLYLAVRECNKLSSSSVSVENMDIGSAHGAFKQKLKHRSLSTGTGFYPNYTLGALHHLSINTFVP